MFKNVASAVAISGMVLLIGTFGSLDTNLFSNDFKPSLAKIPQVLQILQESTMKNLLHSVALFPGCNFHGAMP